MNLYNADRGKGKGEYLMVLSVDKKSNRNQSIGAGSPFTDKAFAAMPGLSSKPSQFLENPESYSEYELIGTDNAGPLPKVELLGFHFIKVAPDKAVSFEKFVHDKLNPKLTRLYPEMGLFYYKAVAGEDKGSYITIFAINSVAGREIFWPTGKPEQQIVKDGFGPLKDLAKELETYLVKDSYLKPESGGGAAIFESLEWTDYVVVRQ
jgi:hypothetical protein